MWKWSYYMDFFHFNETSSLFSSELISWVLKPCTVRLHRSELYTLRIFLIWLLHNVSSLRIFIPNDLLLHTQQFFPAQEYGNAFGCFQSAQGWSALVTLLVFSFYVETKLRFLAKWVLWKSSRSLFGETIKKNTFTVQFNHAFLSLPAIPLSYVLTQVHHNQRKCTWAWT